MERFKKISWWIIIAISSIFITLQLIRFFYPLEIYMDEKTSVPISNKTIISEQYINGTKCIVMESENHGAISCYWGRTYRDNL